MIDLSNFQLELQAKELRYGDSYNLPNLSILLADFKEFRTEVCSFQSNYQGPDYFDIFESLLELKFLLDWTILELQSKMHAFNSIPYQPNEISLNFRSFSAEDDFESDIDRIASVVSGLDKLIQSNRNALIKSKGMNNFFVESLLIDFEKEMEKSRWVFYMFSKY